MCYTKFRRFDWPAFLRALETGQTNRLYRTYVVTHSTSIPEPRHCAVVRPCHCRHPPFRSVSRNARSVLIVNQRATFGVHQHRMDQHRRTVMHVQSNCIPCGFLKSKSVIVWVRHHPLPHSRNERPAAAVVANRNKRQQRVCRHLSQLVAPNLSAFVAICSEQCIAFHRHLLTTRNAAHPGRKHIFA